ncbi:MAG: crotonase/enoyl-CoA hydratase family protein [Myxococcales bacterium]|nr:crotonase/enoyl-CoA hydratase family protein [Myxococcales bacterium]
MTDLLSYELSGGIATISMNDGKVNCLSLDMLKQLRAALDRAEGDQAVVILTGRPGVFSAGFDLKVIQGGDPGQMVSMLRGGAELAERMLSFPFPVVVASTGHALAMGAFLTCSADLRIGADGDFKYGLTEVAIGLTLPYFAVELCRHRLTKPHFDLAANTAQIYAPGAALQAGFLDRVVPADELSSAARAAGEAMLKLDFAAHQGTKLRVREHLLKALRTAIDSELVPPA